MVEITVSDKCTISGLSPEQSMQIKTALTLSNPAFTEAVKMKRYTGKLDRHLEYFEVSGTGLIIPRGFSGPAMKILNVTDFVDLRRTLPPENFTFSGTLRGYQQEAFDAMLRRDFGVLECPTGGGKTIVVLALIAKRQQPTLIVVHSKELLYQWHDRIKQFLGIEAGLIGDGQFDIKDVTVGIVNSVSKHLKELKARFGFLVVDECHRCPAKTFIDVVSQFDCRYLLGLSATPYRRDGSGKVINFYLGRTVHRVDKHHLNEIGAVLRPEIVQVETDFNYDYQDDYTRMLTAATNDEARNTQIVNEALKHQNRGTTLLVSDRVNHCLALGCPTI